MLCASVIIAMTSARLGGYWHIPASVPRVRALIGLNVMLPQSFSQISARMSFRIGDCSPPRMKHSET